MSYPPPGRPPANPSIPSPQGPYGVPSGAPWQPFPPAPGYGWGSPADIPRRVESSMTLVGAIVSAVLNFGLAAMWLGIGAFRLVLTSSGGARDIAWMILCAVLAVIFVFAAVSFLLAANQTVVADDAGIRREGLAGWETSWDRIEYVQLQRRGLFTQLVIVEWAQAQRLRGNWLLNWRFGTPWRSLSVTVRPETAPAFQAIAWAHRVRVLPTF